MIALVEDVIDSTDTISSSNLLDDIVVKLDDMLMEWIDMSLLGTLKVY